MILIWSDPGIGTKWMNTNHPVPTWVRHSWFHPFLYTLRWLFLPFFIFGNQLPEILASDKVVSLHTPPAWPPLSWSKNIRTVVCIAGFVRNIDRYRYGLLFTIPDVFACEIWLAFFPAASNVINNLSLAVQLSKDLLSRSFAHTVMDPVLGITTVAIPLIQYGVGFLQSRMVESFLKQFHYRIYR